MGSSALEADALTTRSTRPGGRGRGESILRAVLTLPCSFGTAFSGPVLNSEEVHQRRSLSLQPWPERKQRCCKGDRPKSHRKKSHRRKVTGPKVTGKKSKQAVWEGVGIGAGGGGVTVQRVKENPGITNSTTSLVITIHHSGELSTGFQKKQSSELSDNRTTLGGSQSKEGSDIFECRNA